MSNLVREEFGHHEGDQEVKVSSLNRIRCHMLKHHIQIVALIQQNALVKQLGSTNRELSRHSRNCLQLDRIRHSLNRLIGLVSQRCLPNRELNHRNRNCLQLDRIRHSYRLGELEIRCCEQADDRFHIHMWMCFRIRGNQRFLDDQVVR